MRTPRLSLKLNNREKSTHIAYHGHTRIQYQHYPMPRLGNWSRLAPLTHLYYCKSLTYSGSNKIAIIALCPYALLWNPCLYWILNWTCCSCSRSPLYLDHAIQGSAVIALYNVHAICKWLTVSGVCKSNHGMRERYQWLGIRGEDFFTVSKYQIWEIPFLISWKLKLITTCKFFKDCIVGLSTV